MTDTVIERLPEETSFKHLTYERRYKKLDRMTDEEREEHRKEQLRNAQRRYRENHGLIKPQISMEEKLKSKKQKAHERYLKRKEAHSPEKELKEKIPESYTIEYQRQYHKNYYNEHKEKLLTRCKEYYHKKREEVKTD